MEIYDQHIIGPEEVLNHEIRVDTIEYYEQPSLIPKDNYKEKFTRPNLNRKHIEVMCSEDIDNTSKISYKIYYNIDMLEKIF
ncbi:unnamed protein product [Rhizophagus irregularis]|nr:unnamed protein product [Rhizophagus irregularis]